MRALIPAFEVLVLAFFAPRVAGAEITPVPDPYGLGERLALLDYLHEHHVATADGESVESLRQRYEALVSGDAAKARGDALSDGSSDEQRVKADAKYAAEQLRKQLLADTGVAYPEGMSVEELKAQAEADRARREEAAAVADEQARAKAEENARKAAAKAHDSASPTTAGAEGMAAGPRERLLKYIEMMKLPMDLGHDELQGIPDSLRGRWIAEAWADAEGPHYFSKEYDLTVNKDTMVSAAATIGPPKRILAVQGGCAMAIEEEAMIFQVSGDLAILRTWNRTAKELKYCFLHR